MTLRVAFFGSPPFAATILDALCGAFNVVAVVTQPDRPSGRGRRTAPTAVKLLAISKGLDIAAPDKPGDSVVVSKLRAARPDVIVTAAYGAMLPAVVLNSPALGCVNVHPSLLPRHRGAAPIPGAILFGDTVTGVTAMLMDEGLDTGPILLQEEFPLGEASTGELFEIIPGIASRLALQALYGLASGNLTPRPQDHAKATYTRTLRKDDGLIDWTEDARRLARFVRAMAPWPGAFTSIAGETLKVWKATSLDGQGISGVVEEVTKDGVVVGAGSGLLRLEEVQIPSKKRVRAVEFARNRRMARGAMLGLPEEAGRYASFLLSFTSESRRTSLKTHG